MVAMHQLGVVGGEVREIGDGDIEVSEMCMSWFELMLVD